MWRKESRGSTRSNTSMGEESKGRLTEAKRQGEEEGCNRATGTKHGRREKQPEKYEGGRTEMRSRLFDEPTVPNDDARR